MRKSGNKSTIKAIQVHSQGICSKFCILLLLGIFSLVAMGQERLGGANGTVTDTTNGVIASATVSLEINATGVVSQSTPAVNPDWVK